MRKHKRSFLLPVAATAMTLGLVVSGCAESERDESGAAERNENEPFIFSGANEPRSLDPILASDGETFRVSRQVFEPLLQHEPGGTEIVGGLAEEWEQNDEGTEFTFHLRDGVTFHDGDELTAEAVCMNYDRWNNITGVAQNSSVTYYWTRIFDGFAENEDPEMPDSNYVGCTADDELTATIEVAEPSARYPAAFSMIALGIMSPSSVEAIEGQEVTGDPEDPSYPDYAMEVGALDGVGPHNTIAGTGPYQYVDWDHDSGEVHMERFEDYWGEPANIRELIITHIGDETARRQALEAGDIHGYDLVAPADVEPLAEAGFQVPTRGVMNLLYLGMAQDARLDDDSDRMEEAEAMADIQVRQAIAHAVDRQRIVDTILPEGGVVATQFQPDTLEGYSDNVTEYDYDPERAQELLADAGFEEGDLELEFCEPTNVTRPYMPAPADIYEIIQSNLNEVGISTERNSMDWNEDYIAYTQDGQCSLYLLGWTADWAEPFNFMGTWFHGFNSSFRFEDDEVFDAVAAPNEEPDPEARVALYEEANEAIMDYLPALPISSSPPSIVFSSDIEPPSVSPLTQEDFSETSWAE